MCWLRHLALRRVALLAALACVACAGAPAGAIRAGTGKEESKLPTVRWDETHSGCTFSRGDDGKYHYGLWSGDVGITLSIDSQELEKVHRRPEPFFGALLSVRYRGKDGLDVSSENISLEFVKHFQVIERSLDPDLFSAKVQNDAAELDHQTAREIEKHPERRESKEAYMRAFLKDITELVEFLSKNSFRPAHLDPGNREVSGWILFSTASKWISEWKKQEEFVLRVPLEGRIYEFPFKLPPQQGELLLRKRE